MPTSPSSTSPSAEPGSAQHRLARALLDAATADRARGLSARSALASDQPDSGPSRPVSERPGPVDGAADADRQPDRSAVARLGAAAFDPGRPGVRVLAALAAVVVAAAAVLAWWSRPRPEPVTPQLAVSTPVVVPTHAAGPAELVVAVTGKVRQPGLVRLPPGARVADALAAAGGPLPDADLDYLNLARKLTDGELIAVGIPPPPEQPGTGVGTGSGAGSGTGGKVNLNTATQSELETLPGVGPALAQRIIDYRTAHGPFEAVSQLRQVSGIGEVRFADLRELVTV